MRSFRRLATRISATVLVALTSNFAWSQAAAGANDPNDKSNDPAAVGMPGGMVLRMGPTMLGRDALAASVATLGECNLDTGFELSPEQKRKLQAIRDDFTQATEAWQKDHADELKDIDLQQEEMATNLQNGTLPDPNQMHALNEQREQLMSTAPNGVDHVKQLREMLTPDQLNAFEAKQAEQMKRLEAMQGRFPMRFSVRPGGGAMIFGRGAGDEDKDKDKDKEKEKDKGK